MSNSKSKHSIIKDDQQLSSLRANIENDRFASSFQFETDIALKTTYEKRAEEYKTGIQKNYEKLFKDKLIPFSNKELILEEVLRRAFDKTPPFSSADNASDKGFKDALIWLSIVDYFKENGEAEIVFVTDDNGFNKSAKM